MLLNCSSAACRFSAISAAKIAGGGRFSVSSMLSSLSQKMSMLALSRWCKSAKVNGLKFSFGLRLWRFSVL